MQEDLRRINSIGDSPGILYFASKVLKSELILKDSARLLCSFVDGIRINFNGAVAFFEYLGFISVSTDSLIPTEFGKNFYFLLNDGFEEALCEACISKMISDEIIDTTALRFDATKGIYYIQRHGFPIATAIFRNVLIQLNALKECQDGSGSLEIIEKYEAFFIQVQKKKKREMSLDALKKQLERQQLQGEEAENYVVEYEKARLFNAVHANKIKRISGIDVSAGYDIVSFDDSKCVLYERFIEVKSYIGQPHFYWSKNEIQVATLYADRYYLYLVDMRKIKDCGYSPTIIQNPAKAVIESDGWLMQPESYLVLPSGAE